MNSGVSTSGKRLRHGRGLAALIGLLALIGSTAAGCSTHDVAVSRPCAISENGRRVAVNNRGGIGMPKLALTPRRFKVQERTCS
jgi:hypothetical protein